MKRNHFYPAFALTALTAALSAPAALADTTDRYDMVVPPHNVIDLINGNDARDHRDSTKLRNDVRLDEPMPGAIDSQAADDPSFVERNQVENIQSGPETANDALSAAATDSAGDVVRSGVSSDDTMNSPHNASAAADGDRDDSTTNRGAQGDAVMPGDGGGEVGVPGPRDSSAETDSFEGERDTAAGVESTRGAGGGGGPGGTTGGGGGAGAAGGGAGGAGAGGAGAGAGGGGAGR
jgi:hypothetical protein